MAEVRKGTACSWGVGVSTTTSYGRVVNSSRRKTSEKAMLKDQDGDIATKVYHGAEEQVTLEIVPTATTYSTPAVGDTIIVADSIGDQESSYFHVDEVNDVQTIGDAARITLTCSRAADISA
jgi:hypothetical protein